jgi:hypothetical protein
MSKDELLDKARELEFDLYDPEFRKWVKAQSEPNKAKIGSLRTEVISYRSGLETNQLKVLANKLEELSPELDQGLADLQKEMKNMKDFITFLKILSSVLGLVSRIVTLAG